MGRGLDLKCCCFSGYRPEKMPFDNANEILIPQVLYADIYRVVLDQYNKGCKHFITGMGRGFDLWAAQVVIQLRVKYGDIHLTCAIPYYGHESSWKSEWERLHNAVLQRANSKIYICDEYRKDCYHIRNRYMVDNSDTVICYYNGQKGGTKYTLDYAYKCGLDIINIANNQMSLNCPMFTLEDDNIPEVIDIFSL